MRRTATYALITTIATTARTAAQRAEAVADSDTTMRAQAKVLLQGADTLPWLSETRIALVAHALRVIHAQFPQLGDVDVGDGGAMLVYFSDSVYESVVVSSGAQRPAALDLFWHAEIRHTGIPALDSLDATYGVKRTIIWTSPTAVSLEFGRPANVPVIRAAYLRIPQVRLAVNPWNQDAMGIHLVDKGSKLDFVFGPPIPCLIECGPTDVSYVAYDTATQTATMAHHVEHHVARGFPPSFAWRPDSIAYWDVPSRLTIVPYANLDSLVAGVHADLWWHRSHAVAVLADLLGPAIGPWQGGGERSPGQFQTLKLAAAARREEALRAIIDRVNDPDPTVARAALDALRSLSHQHYGNDAASLTRWRRWAHDLPNEPSPLEIRFINVGQGDAVLIRQGAQAALVDAGPPNDSIVAHLRTLGVDSLQLFVTTLDEPDRSGSAAAVRSAIPVATLIDNEHARRRTIRFGDTRIEIIPPISRDSASHINGSAAVRITRGSFRALLTGGLTGTELGPLVARDGLGHVNLLNAPQHGDTTAVMTPWLGRLAPDVVVIGAAKMDVVSGASWRYQSPKRTIASTLWNGDIAAIVNGDGTYSVQSFSGPLR
ncbi:MAG TPA: hypothetical protein VN651_12235 [Gemmatimonadaceae bacterium]|nr:hypothetical protein [Gemmatimonadaceae bacterium]